MYIEIVHDDQVTVPVLFQGPKGEQGPAGPEGPAGPQGASITGPAGPQGVQGPAGQQGVQGPQGPAGQTGPSGPQGVQGPQGQQGPQGAQGPAGQTGPAGRDGKDGKDGVLTLDLVQLAENVLADKIAVAEDRQAINVDKEQVSQDRQQVAQDLQQSSDAIVITTANRNESAALLDQVKSAVDQVSTGVGTAEPSSSPQPNIKIVNVSTAGTYTNFGGIVVSAGDLSAGLVQLRLVGGIWQKVITPISLGAYSPSVDLRSNTLFENYYALDNTWKARAQGILDLKIYSSNVTDVWYVAIIRSLASGSGTSFFVTKAGTNGAVGASIAKTEVDADSDKILTKTAIASDGSIIHITIDFNLVIVNWNNSVYDDPAQMMLTVSKNRMLLKPVTAIVNDLTTGGATAAASAETVKTLNTTQIGLTELSTLSTNLFTGVAGFSSVWRTRMKGILDIKIYTANLADVWYVSAIRTLANGSAAKFIIAKYGTNGATAVSIDKATVDADADKIVTATTVAADGTRIDMTIDFNQVATDWNNTVYDDPAQMILTVAKGRMFLKPVTIVNDLTTGGTTSAASAETVKTLNTTQQGLTELSTLSTNLFVGVAGFSSVWRSRMKGIRDIKIYTDNLSDIWYVSIIRNLANASSTKFAISKYGTAGATSITFSKAFVDADADKIITLAQTALDGTIIEVSIDFNLVTDAWNISAYDTLAEMVLIVSSGRMFAKPKALVNDLTTGGANSAASAETVKTLNTLQKGIIGFKSTGKSATLWKNSFTDPSWSKTGWTDVAEGVQTVIAGSANKLLLNRAYLIEKRHDRLKFKMSADAVLCVQYLPKENTSPAVCLEVNISSAGTFNLGNNTGTGVGGMTTPFTFVSNREYVLDVTRIGADITVKITDMVTAQSWSYVRNSTNYTSYMTRETISCFMISGSSVTVTGMEITVPRLNLVIRGDSNTEGVVITTATNRWADMVISALPAGKKGSVAGRYGGRITGLTEASNNESLIMLPDYEMITIGTNGGNTVSNITAYCQGLLNAGVQPILNTVVCRDNGAHTAINTDILTVVSALNLPCVRFDIATALNNDLAQGYNPAIYDADGIHLNAAGQTALFNRVKADVPFLFD